MAAPNNNLIFTLIALSPETPEIFRATTNYFQWQCKNIANWAICREFFKLDEKITACLSKILNIRTAYCLFIEDVEFLSRLTDSGFFIFYQLNWKVHFLLLNLFTSSVMGLSCSIAKRWASIIGWSSENSLSFFTLATTADILRMLYLLVEAEREALIGIQPFSD